MHLGQAPSSPQLPVNCVSTKCVVEGWLLDRQRVHSDERGVDAAHQPLLTLQLHASVWKSVQSTASDGMNQAHSSDSSGWLGGLQDVHALMIEGPRLTVAQRQLQLLSQACSFACWRPDQ